jgi:hypothetical protein
MLKKQKKITAAIPNLRAVLIQKPLGLPFGKRLIPKMMIIGMHLLSKKPKINKKRGSRPLKSTLIPGKLCKQCNKSRKKTLNLRINLNP